MAKRKRDRAEKDVGGYRRRELFVVVSYDIPDNKRRLKIMKTLEGFGKRVQFSVFECYLSAEQYKTLQQRLTRLAAKGVDDVRFYQLCGSCQGRRKGLGKGRPQQRKPHIMVE